MLGAAGGMLGRLGEEDEWLGRIRRTLVARG